MKNVRRSFAAALLLLALTVVALADGQMGTPLTTPTPPGQMNILPATSSTTGDEAGQMDALLTDVALALLESLPTLF